MKKQSRYYFLVMLMYASVLSVSAQRTVTAKVVDKISGAPVAGATITQVGSSVSTVSNALGFFQIQADSGAMLEISGQGYPVMRITVPKTTTFKIELAKSVAESSPPRIYTVVDEDASFPGGWEKFKEYVRDNVVVPEEVQSGKADGTVFVSFLVDSSGLIPANEVQVARGVCPACDREALRLIKESPRWKPGIQAGERVFVRMVMPIRFKKGMADPAK